MTSAEHSAAKKQISTDYKAAKEQCKALSANAKDVCEKEASGREKIAKAELEALREPCELDLNTDSQYVRQGILEWLRNWIRRGWKTAGGDPVKNRDLWERLHAATQRHTIEWRWVKGHSGDPDNERVDLLAREAAERYRDLKQAG